MEIRQLSELQIASLLVAGNLKEREEGMMGASLIHRSLDIDPEDGREPLTAGKLPVKSEPVTD